MIMDILVLRKLMGIGDDHDENTVLLNLRAMLSKVFAKRFYNYCVLTKPTTTDR